MRIFASNDTVDLEREHIDVALRFVPPDTDAPNADCLVEYRTFPACLPAIARGRKRPLRTAADLALHVRLDFETILYGRPSISSSPAARSGAKTWKPLAPGSAGNSNGMRRELPQCSVRQSASPYRAG